MRKQRSNRASLILTAVLSVIAFALVIVLCFQHGILGSAGGNEPVSAHTGNEENVSKGNDSNPSTSTLADEDRNATPTKTDFVFKDGFSINGVNLSGKSWSDITDDSIRTELEGTNPEESVKLSFKVGDEVVTGDSSSAIVFYSNLDEILSEAQRASEAGSEQKEYTTEWKFSRDAIEDVVHDALDKYTKEPVEAYASGFNTESLTFVIEDSQSGVAIDFDGIVDRIEESFKSGNYAMEIPVETTVVEPKTTAEFLRGYLCKVSSTTSTTTSSSNRNTNIRLVCEKLDGLVLQPGEQFDFNKYIGERTEAAGFKEAGGIYNGALRQELGGGICQANAMIFHSVVKADLQVDTRSPHTWPSDYVEIGTDATVSWGGPEFRFTNNSDYPIALHAYYGNQKVTVEVYGRPLPDGMTIKLKGEETSRTEAKVEYKADSDMALDTKVTEKSAHDAIKAKAYKIYYDANGNEIKREEAFYSSYPMINKVVRVGTRAEDGTIFKLDKETGETIAPEGYVSPTPTPDADEEDGQDGSDDGDDEDEPEPTPTKKPKKPKKGEDEDTSDEGAGESGNADESGESGDSGSGAGDSGNAGESGDSGSESGDGAGENVPVASPDDGDVVPAG